MTLHHGLRAAAGYAPASGGDPYFSSVSLLLHGDGTNGAQNNTFLDSSSNALTITRNGNATQGSFSPFALGGAAYSTATNGGSGRFDGSADWLDVAASSAFAFGTGDFTMEYWVYPVSFSTSPSVLDTRANNSSTTGYLEFFSTAGKLNLYIAASIVYTSTATVSTGAWTHIAVTRSGTSLRVFINGTQDGSTVTNSTNFTDTSCRVGANVEPSPGSLNGYLSNVRILKGTALYTSNFTPPTSPLTAITNTSLLLNFTNGGIIDNAAKNDLETVGNAQISTSVKKYGTGSMAFDGSGDYLSTPNGSWSAFGTGDFTVECWLNFNSSAGAQGIVHSSSTSGGNFGFSFFGGRIYIFTVGGPGINFAYTISTGSWVHFALVRSGTTLTVYAGGTSIGSSGFTNNVSGTANTIIGAEAGPTSYFNGYIDDLRFTKGVARYTSNFTPPTAAFPDN